MGTEDTLRKGFLKKVKFELSLEGKVGINSYVGKGWGAKYLLFLLDRTDCYKIR